MNHIVTIFFALLHLALADDITLSACNNTADFAILNATSKSVLSSDITSCTIPCLGKSECVANCLRDKLGLSQACADCFGEDVSCTVANCAFQCISPSSSSCKKCQDKYCTPSFVACSGVNPQ
eukprot:TRINITY_DN16485_c0_g1_i1.p1 TRINITY_DN16485_c0_g1~~TRINITY_DN16485_c0_g1_i1.p1  ORF type:complete len:123 (+),score=3.46 TRINITY_DN16485_c0_g1_i1:61-429(+)